MAGPSVPGSLGKGGTRDILSTPFEEIAISHFYEPWYPEHAMSFIKAKRGRSWISPRREVEHDPKNKTIGRRERRAGDSELAIR